METETTFDLNRAIRNWRESLAHSPAFRGENVDELESHLRDSVAALESRGLSASEAFQIATQRVGGVAGLESEFRKVNGRAVWLDRFFWMLIGIQAWGLISGLVFSIARNGYAFGWTHLNHDSKTNGMALPVAVFTIVQVLAFAASVALCWWLIVRKGRRVLARLAPWLRRRGTFIAVCAAFCLFAFFVQIFNGGLSALLFWAYGPDKVRHAMMYSSYAQLWVLPFQTAALIAVTLVLARRRLRVAGS